MNNYPVTIASADFPGDSSTQPFRVVLRDLGPREPCRYVTHCQLVCNGSYFWGHYFHDETTARQDFVKRCLKYIH